MRHAHLILILLISSACSQPPMPELCTIVDYDKAFCIPSDPRDEERDIKVSKMLGYTCMSSNDFGDVKKYVKGLLEKIE